MASKSLFGSSKGLKKLLMPFLLFLSGIFLLTRTGKRASALNHVPVDFDNAMMNAWKEDTAYPDSCRLNWEAVSKMETAGFTSDLYRNYLNPWGMGDASGRKNAQSGIVLTKTMTFAKYDSINDAARDIILWMNAASFPKISMSLAEHVAAMGAVKTGSYYGDQSAASYLKIVEAWLNK